MKLKGSEPLKSIESDPIDISNPKYSLREWLLAPAYQQAAKGYYALIRELKGYYALIRELQEVMTHPYDEQSKAVEEKFYKLKAPELNALGGVSHMSCSS